jgi:aryl-alcohol dehydrogenase-like predicted oxidoreductase
MDHVNLGRTGLKVSRLCLGAMTFGEGTGFMKGVSSPDDVARRVLDAAFEAGIDFIDTADVYSAGSSEAFVGKWLAGRRDQVVVATKCRFNHAPQDGKPGVRDVGLSRRHIVAACEGSLRRLGTDYIDLYQVHMQEATTPIEETLRALDDLVTAGKIRYAGCSNYTGYRLVESLWAADKRNTIKYESVQLQWSLIVRDAEREIIPACRAFGLGVLVWSPLARGFLSGKYEKDKAPPPGTRLAEWKDTWAGLQKDQPWAIVDVVRAIAAERQATPAAVSLAWLLAKPETTSVIIGARDEPQLRANLAALEVKLSPEDVKRLDDVSKIEWGYPQSFIAMREAW